MRECHLSARAFSDKGPTSHGANPTLFGPRNAPNITYAMFDPPLQSGGDEGPLSFFGGQFRDGRANFLTDQAKLPLLNPIEMGNRHPAANLAVGRAAQTASTRRASTSSASRPAPRICACPSCAGRCTPAAAWGRSPR